MPTYQHNGQEYPVALGSNGPHLAVWLRQTAFDEVTEFAIRLNDEEIPKYDQLLTLPIEHLTELIDLLQRAQKSREWFDANRTAKMKRNREVREVVQRSKVSIR